MTPVFLDFETYYDKEYSLRKMTPVQYILDPRFEVIGCAVKVGLGGSRRWLSSDELGELLKTLDPTKTILVSHNALFDMCIVSWVYSFKPRLFICTMAIARAILGHKLRSLALSSVAKYLGLGVKGGTVHKVLGMRRADIIAAGLMDEYAEYSMDDADLCAGIWEKLVHGGLFPISELAIMDMILRCAIEPVFVLDANKLAEHLGQVRADKEQLLVRAMEMGATGKADLMSNAKFAELLRGAGVEPPTKISKTTGEITFAFSKSDPAFLELEEHDSPAVQALMGARMGHKSTLEETRTQRMIDISFLTWPGNRQGLMPMPIRPSGAHTHRGSGDWKLNVQNFSRGGKIRESLQAPDGHDVLTVDASQIEARINAVLCGCKMIVDQFANREDVYSNFATKVFGFPVNKKDHPTERFVGKQAQLGLGFQLGAPTFRDRLETDSKNQTGSAIVLTPEKAAHVVSTYRGEQPEMPATWKLLGYTAIPALAHGTPFHWGPLVWEKQAILGPHGLRLHYHDLHWDAEIKEWRFTHGGTPKKLYGGKLLENIVQFLDRAIVFAAGARIIKRCHEEHGLTYIRLKQQAHDENVFVPRKEHTEIVKRIAMEEMTRRPDWMPDVPLDAEWGVGPTYGDAK